MTTEPLDETRRRRDMTEELASLKLRGGSAEPERRWLIAGGSLTVFGVGLSIVSWLLSQGTNNPLSQSTDLSLSILGMTVAIVGAAIWMRHSLTRYTRYFLARLIFEERTQADRIVASLDVSGFEEVPLADSAGTGRNTIV